LIYPVGLLRIKVKTRSLISNMLLKPGATGVVKLDGQGAQLGNNGGIITLLDPERP